MQGIHFFLVSIGNEILFSCRVFSYLWPQALWKVCYHSSPPNGVGWLFLSHFLCSWLPFQQWSDSPWILNNGIYFKEYEIMFWKFLDLFCLFFHSPKFSFDPKITSQINDLNFLPLGNIHKKEESMVWRIKNTDSDVPQMLTNNEKWNFVYHLLLNYWINFGYTSMHQKIFNLCTGLVI